MEIVRWLHLALGGPERAWLAVTSLGTESAFIVLLTLYYWLLNPRGGRLLGVTFALSYLANTVLKVALHEPRPFFLDPTLSSDAARATAGGGGMPSGHAQMSATFWGLTAAQLERRWFSWAAGALVAVICLSRLVLGVHFASDVVVGLALGAGFVALALRVRYPWHWGVPVLALVAAVFFEKFAPALGLLAGMWMTRSVFDPPRGWAGRAVVGALGLGIVFGVFLAFRVFPDGIRHSGAVAGLRYCVLALTGTELVPRIFGRFMPRVE